LEYWPFWVSGLALASVMLIHWFTTGRMMAVSGRFSALVNRLRYRDDPPVAEEALAGDDLLAAIRAMTAETFGESALEAQAEPAIEQPKQAAPTVALQGPQPSWLHVIFFASLALGGLLSVLLAGPLSLSWTLRGEGFRDTFGSGAGSAAVLLLGGVLTGFGTRMAGGCTSGHGLCGVSRVQPGSLLATAGFFGTGILVSFLLEAL